MNEILKHLIEYLPPPQLQDIFTVNKLPLPGFRIVSTNTAAKTKKMKQELSNKKDLDKILFNTINYYREKLGRDFSWALPTNIDIDDIKRHVSQSNIGEVAYALISAGKIDLLKELLGLNNLHENEDNAIESFEKQIIDENDNSKTVKELRKIIDDLETKNKILMFSKDNTVQKLNELKANYTDLDSRFDKVNKKLSKYEKKNEGLQNTISENQQEIAHLKEDIDIYKKMKLIVYGGNEYQELWKLYAESIQGLLSKFCSSEESLDQNNEITFFDHLVILPFSLNTTEFDNLKRSNVFLFFLRLHKIIYLNTVNEVKEYLEKVRIYYA